MEKFKVDIFGVETDETQDTNVKVVNVGSECSMIGRGLNSVIFTSKTYFGNSALKNEFVLYENFTVI